MSHKCRLAPHEKNSAKLVDLIILGTCLPVAFTSHSTQGARGGRRPGSGLAGVPREHIRCQNGRPLGDGHQVRTRTAPRAAAARAAPAAHPGPGAAVARHYHDPCSLCM